MKIWFAANMTLLMVSTVVGVFGFIGDDARRDLRKQYPDKIIPDSRLPMIGARGVMLALLSGFLWFLAVLWRWAT